MPYRGKSGMADKKTLEMLIKVVTKEAVKKVRELSGDIKQLAQTAKREADDISQSIGGSNGMAGIIKEIKDSVKGLAAVTAAVQFDKKVASMAESAMQTASSFQACKDEFGIMLGDMKAGTAFFNELQKFNFWTPFDIEQTSRAAKVLISAKTPLEDITQYLTRFGDIAQGDAQRFQSFISAFSKASAKGKADMEVLNVYTDQGVQILDALGKQMGVTSAEIVDMASKGKISFRDLDAALASLAADGGLYHGTLETAAMRLDSVYAGLVESSKSLAASFGDMLSPAASGFLTVLTGVIDAINESPFLKGTLAAALTAITAGVNILAFKALTPLIAKLWSAFTAQMSLNSAMSVLNPLLLAGVAAATAAVGIYTAVAAGHQKAAEAAEEQALAEVKLKDKIENSTKAQLIQMSTQARIEKYYLQKNLREANARLKSMGGPQLADAGESYGQAKKKVEELTAALAQVESILKDTDKQMAKIDATEAKKKAQEEINRKIEEGAELQKEFNRAFEQTESGQEKALKDAVAWAEALKGAKIALKDAAGNVTETALPEEQVNAVIDAARKKLDEFYAKRKELADKAAEDERNRILNEEKERRQALLNEAEERLNAIKEEYKLKKILAEKDGNYVVAAGYAAQEAVADTQLGNLISGVAGPLMQLAGALIEALMSVESVGKVLNWAGTIVEGMMEVLEPVIDDIFSPIAELLTDIGRELGQILAPSLGIFALAVKVAAGVLKVLSVPAKALAGAFEWFYNRVIVPVGNKIVDVFNSLIDLLNKIPYVNISKLSKLSYVGQKAEEMAEAMEKATDIITKDYDRQIDKVRDQLNAQIDSIKAQYELGLMTRDEYTKKADEYQAAADAKTESLEKAKADAIEAIKNNTEVTAENTTNLSGSIPGTIESLKERLAAIGATTITVADKAETAAADIKRTGSPTISSKASPSTENPLVSKLSAATSLSSKLSIAAAEFIKVAGRKHYDTGSVDIPEDTAAIVHKGETIIPRTFAEGIRSGTLTLSGGRNSQATGTIAAGVTVNVAGSVVTERELIDVVYEGISRAITSGSRQPLPVGA